MRHHAQLRRTLTIVIASFALSGTALAQSEIPNDRFSVNRFTPAVGPNNYFATDGAQLSGHLVPGGGLVIDFGHRAFSVYGASCTGADQDDCTVEDRQTNLVNYQLNFNLMGSIIIADRIQVGLVVPLSLMDGDALALTADGMPTTLVQGGTNFAVGDPTLSVKARLYGEGEGIFLGATVYATAPIANLMADDAFIGDESLRVGGHFIAQYVQNGFHLAANIGGFYRPERTFLSTTAGSQITYRAAIGYEVTPLIMIFGEVDGAFGLSKELDVNPLEARLGGRFRAGDLTFSLGGGAGIISGVGVPTARVLAGMAYAPERGDRDGDGIDDAQDACPTEAEDMDEFEDSDGCPEEDNDQDGMLDADDPCPTQAEDMDGFEDEDGCPDTDNDEDGVRDGFDSCPNDPEDMDGDRDEDGCPDNDTDRDGIDDVDDQCPDEMEDADGFGDEDGCPEVDFDGDGIPDDGDECPDAAEIINGINDEDGCPEPDDDGDGIVNENDRCPERAETLNGRADDDGCPDGEALISLEAQTVTFGAPVRFGRRGRIRGGTRELLGTLILLMRRNPGLTLKIDIAAGREAEAQAQVESTKAFLTDNGVAENRLEFAATAGDDAFTMTRTDVSAPAE